jgi:hypothetical protein
MVAAVAAAVALAPIRLPARTGWHAGAGAVHACVGEPASRCRNARSWAGTIALRDCLGCLPHRTVAVLPPDGVLIQVTTVRERPRRLRGGPWPPRVDPAAVSNFEGLPGRIGVYQQTVRLGPLDATIMVFFGRPRPRRAEIIAADAELRDARLP